MAKPRKVELPAGKKVRYARPEMVREATDRIFRVYHDLLRRLAEYERTEKKKGAS